MSRPREFMTIADPIAEVVTSTTSIVWVLPSETRGIAATEQASPSSVTREMPRVTPWGFRTESWYCAEW